MSVNLYLKIERKKDNEWECVTNEVSDLINENLLRDVTNYGREGNPLRSKDYDTMSEPAKVAFSHQISSFYDGGKKAWKSGIKEFSHHLACDYNGFLERMERWSNQIDTCHQPVYFKWLDIPWDLLEYNWLDWNGNDIPEKIKAKLPETDASDIEGRKKVFADTVRKMFLNGEIDKKELRELTNFEEDADGRFTCLKFADTPYEAIERLKYTNMDADDWFKDGDADVMLAYYNEPIWEYDNVNVMTISDIDDYIKEKEKQLKKYKAENNIDGPVIEAIRLAVSNNPLIFGNDAIEKFNKAVRKVSDEDEDWYDEEYAEDLQAEIDELKFTHRIMGRLVGYDDCEVRLLYTVQ